MKKHFEKYFLFGFLILAIVASLLVFFGFTFSTNENTGKIINTAKTIVKEEQGFKLISSGSTGQGEVSVDLKPHNVKDGTLKVDISVNTHSVNLEQFNLNEITILEFDDKVKLLLPRTTDLLTVPTNVSVGCGTKACLLNVAALYFLSTTSSKNARVFDSILFTTLYTGRGVNVKVVPFAIETGVFTVRVVPLIFTT